MSVELWGRTVDATVDDALPWFPVAMFHRVVDRTPAVNPYNLCIGAGDLERVLRFIRRDGFEIVSLRAALDAAEQGRDVSRLACLTFDDGYRDFYTHAFPVLQRLDAPATVFLVSDRLGGTNDWDSATGVLPSAPLLSHEEVLSLAAQGIEFGCHSATHPHLDAIDDRQLRDETAGAKQTLEALLDREAGLYAYPYTDENAAVRRAVEEAGFRGAVSGEQPRHTRYLIHRVDFRRLDALSLRFRLHGVRYRLKRTPGAYAARNVIRGLISRSRSVEGKT